MFFDIRHLHRPPYIRYFYALGGDTVFALGNNESPFRKNTFFAPK
ncbi:hypothetical protein DBT_0320 [Dissulfuribacter thermophilus]|uniref:Uncharacterized protein n=1 Tax=Dissulfuribacter thermophilus TaxID=1156395 RepID=A0A1B9F9E2_9BACT|nr:hypothetical protein DBT_0320 [Dissulfuribacter thermophilus]